MKHPAENPTRLIDDLNEAQIVEILENNYIGSLAFIAHNSPYVLPITYHFLKEEGCIISYSMEGHKMDALREQPNVSFGVFEMDSIAEWRSVLLHGTFEELHQIDAKQYSRKFANGVREKLKGSASSDARFIEDFSSKAHSHGIPVIYRINIGDWSGKHRKG